MRGEQHVIYSLLSLLILLPLLKYSYEYACAYLPLTCGGELFYLVLFTVGCFIGSLIPDADTSDSAVMHGMSGGKGAVRRLKRHTVLILPIFGYAARYLIYYPVSVLMYILTLGRVKPGHRGLMHSLFGAAVSGAGLFIFMEAAINILLSPFFRPEIVTELSACAAVFAAAVFSGEIMHLLEDTCTERGVIWLFPFSRTVFFGTAGDKSRKNYLIFLILSAAALFSLTLSHNGINNADAAVFLPAIIFIAAWGAVFMICSVKRR